MQEIFLIHGKTFGEMDDIDTFVIREGNRTEGALDCMGVVSTVIMGVV